MKFRPNARIRNSSKDGAYDEILFTPMFAIGAVRAASVALAKGSGAMLVVLGATVMLLFKSQLKLLDVDNAEYKAKRDVALQKPGAVIGQTTIQN